MFQPSVKLLKKTRVGSKLRRRYDTPAAPLDRVARSTQCDRARLGDLMTARQRLDPFVISAAIESDLNRIWLMRTKAPKPAWLSPSPLSRPQCYSRKPMQGPPHEPATRPVFERYERIQVREAAFLAE